MIQELFSLILTPQEGITLVQAAEEIAVREQFFKVG